MLINVPFLLVPLCSKGNALFIFFSAKTVIFHLFSAIRVFFVKEVPIFLISSGPHHPRWVLGDLSRRLEHMVEFWIGLSIHFVSGQLSVKPSETRPVLNYSYMIATSWFFEKIIFSIPICCFIMDVMSLLEDSPPRHQRPSSPFWPKFAGATKNLKITQNTWNLRTLLQFST